MTAAVLTINAGSSSIKFSAFAHDGSADDLSEIAHGQVSGIGVAPVFEAVDPGRGKLPAEPLTGDAADGHRGALRRILDWLPGHIEGASVTAIGHRVVHGGTAFSKPVRLDEVVLAELDALVPLAPLHQPHNLSPVRAIAEMHPDLPQIACFDTAFHRTQPECSRLFALPYRYFQDGVERYGFHGLSYEYISRALPGVINGPMPARVVVAHLGNGASLCAMRDGVSHASSMGFTALDGLPMGTRSGQIDPGVLLYLMDEKGMDAPALSDLLYKDSGLKGLSGIGFDLRDLLGSADPGAARALGYFTDRIAQGIAAMAASLGGIDALVFTAGIGEHAAPIRARVLGQLAFLGFRLDTAANDRHGPRITADGHHPAAWVVPTNEELMIATHALDVLNDA